MEKGVASQPDISADEAVKLYDEKIAETKALMDVLFAKAGAGVNLLTQYVQNFNGVGLGW